MVSYIKVGIEVKEFKNGILRGIFGSKSDENEEQRRLHNHKIFYLYHLPNISGR